MKKTILTDKGIAGPVVVIVVIASIIIAGVGVWVATRKPAEVKVGELEVSNLLVPTVKSGKDASISVDVKNVGEAENTWTLDLKVDGVTRASKTVTLGPGESETVTLTTTEKTGTYTIDVAGLTKTLTVNPWKMGLVLGGDETDMGWCSIALIAADEIGDEYGWEIGISRLVSFADGPRVIRDYAERGYDVVWAQGGQFIGATYFEVAPAYEDTYFVQFAGLDAPLPPPNLVVPHCAFQTGGFYLGGVLAGKMTETNAVAWVVGEWYPYTAMEFYAFKAGIESVNPDAKVYAREAGTWADASLGYQIAKSLIETKNVDIIAHVADLTGRGIIAACNDLGIKVMGSCADQSLLAPDVVLTSVMIDLHTFMDLVAREVMEGTFKKNIGGTIVDMELGYLAPFHRFEDVVPQAVKDLLIETEEDIETGAIVVPRIYTEELPPDPA